MNENLGLGPTSDLLYIKLDENQNLLYEFSNIRSVIVSYVKDYCKENEVSIDDITVEFINYGYNQLVYVMTVKDKGRYAILVKQPMAEYGSLKREYDNLCRLNKVDSNVIAPIDYRSYENDKYRGELFVTPYMYQARCVASDLDWGMYVPDPEYRFEKFSFEQRFFVNMCMIAKLVYLYDEELNQGVCACKLGGGDFILPKDWEEYEPCENYTLNSLYLTAARDMVSCSLNEYIELIRSEFSRATIEEEQSSLVINHRGRVAMSMEEIEEGIELGLKLRKRKEAIYPKTNR